MHSTDRSLGSLHLLRQTTKNLLKLPDSLLNNTVKPLHSHIIEIGEIYSYKDCYNSIEV